MISEQNATRTQRPTNGAYGKHITQNCSQSVRLQSTQTGYSTATYELTFL